MMKKLSLFLLLLFFSCCRQQKISDIFKDSKITTVNSQDLYTVIDTVNKNPRIPTFLNKRVFLKSTKKPLDGLFKVITSEDSYFTSRYKKGISPSSFNITKYYLHEKIVSIKYEFISLIGNKYIYVPNYSCDSIITGYYMSYEYDCINDDMTKHYNPNCIIDTLFIQQYRKLEIMQWQIKSKLNTPYNLEVYGISKGECP